ncbi:MAG: 1-acyl-sn-glycerol-3-phosphate acyltransferase [Treponema sp.]|jgi:1-acyl-sn-glycerol-3-phosphate acyltransferase|nr:1-acyl-sn-glycerol-3-phosphate acyltransferase [Treponema sp.]
MAYLKTTAAFLITGMAAIVYIPAAALLFIIGLFNLKRPMSFVLYKLAQAWARIIIIITGCPMTVSGRENIPKKGGLCFVSNHVGIFDIVLALAYAGRPFGFIAKKELLFLPGINIWIYLLGGLFIDRRQPRKALKTINLGVKRIKAGGAMMVFPEGTRSRGRGLAAFHPGSLKLASQSEALIIPVAISGSFDVFEKNHLINTVPVCINFLTPMDPADIPPQDRKNLLAEKLHDSIAEVLDRQGGNKPS